MVFPVRTPRPDRRKEPIPWPIDPGLVPPRGLRGSPSGRAGRPSRSPTNPSGGRIPRRADAARGLELADQPRPHPSRARRYAHAPATRRRLSAGRGHPGRYLAGAQRRPSTALSRLRPARRARQSRHRPRPPHPPARRGPRGPAPSRASSSPAASRTRPPTPTRSTSPSTSSPRSEPWSGRPGPPARTSSAAPARHRCRHPQAERPRRPADVGWVKPTECRGPGPVGCTHPTEDRPFASLLTSPYPTCTILLEQ